MSEPTERSIPPVAITSVMPTATMTMGATWVRLTESVCSDTKFGVTAALKASRTTRASRAPLRRSTVFGPARRGAGRA